MFVFGLQLNVIFLVMIDSITHIINKLILPKYPEITSFSVTIDKKRSFTFYDVDFSVNSRSHCRTSELSKETERLFVMLGPEEYHEICVVFTFD